MIGRARIIFDEKIHGFSDYSFLRIAAAKHHVCDPNRLTALIGGSFAMDETQIYTKLTGLFEDVFDEDSIKLSPGLSAKDVDGWDSLTHIRLMLTVEKAFKIKLSTSEIGKLQNVGDLVALIKALA